MENLCIEIEALRIAAPLLSDDGGNNSAAPISTRWVSPTRPFQVAQAANSDPQPEHALEWKERNRGLPVTTRCTYGKILERCWIGTSVRWIPQTW